MEIISRLGEATKKGLSTQALILAAASGTAQIVMALVYIVIARATEPAEFGVVIAAVSVGSVVAGMLDFGSNNFCLRETVAGRMSREELGSRLMSKLLVAVTLILIATSVLFLVGPRLLWTAGPCALALMANQSMQAVVRGSFLNSRLSLSLIVDRLIMASCAAMIWVLHADLAAHLWIALVFGSLASALICYLSTPATGRPLWLKRQWTSPWNGCGHLGLFSMANNALNLDVPLTGAFGGPLAAGLYGAVSRLTQPMSLIVGAFGTVAMPIIAQSKSARAAWDRVRSAVWLLGFAVLLCIFVALAGPWLVNGLIGSKYVGSERVLVILALGAIPVVFSQPMIVFLQARGFDRIVAWVGLFGVFAQLALLCLLARLFGAIGSAWAMACMQTVTLLVLCWVMVTAARGRATSQNRPKRQNDVDTRPGQPRRD